MSSFSWEPFGAARGADAPQPPTDPAPAAPAAPEPTGFRRLPREPTRKLVVITCMDSRVDPLGPLGLSLGEAHVIRNAGATISDDVLRSLNVSESKLGTRRAVLMGHTDCAGHESDAAMERSLIDGIRRIRAQAVVPDSFGLDAVVYDVDTGEIRPVSG
jgi:carbonic anhydrase